MPDSKSADTETAVPSLKRNITRRIFLRDISLVSLLALCSTGLLQACKPRPANTETTPPATPAKTSTTPAAKGKDTLLEAIKNRQSAGTLKADPLPAETLLELLWSAWGINRPDSGKRTAPSAMNAQDIDLYVLTADGTYIYDAQANQIKSVLAEDIRGETGIKASLASATQLIYVADYARFRAGSREEQEKWSACHTGFIGQNVYLYCAANGLGARFYAGFNREVIKEALKLREDQVVLFGQAVGYIQ